MDLVRNHSIGQGGSRPTPKQPMGGRFYCSFPRCKASYARREHLNRHTTQHLNVQLFACPFCDRAFPRKDTLRRHAKSHHDSGDVGRARALKACTNCRGRKASCRGCAPCDGCLERGLQCSLAPLRQRSRSPEPERNEASTSKHPQQPQTLPAQIEPGSSDTRVYIDAYFAKFHPKWPFLHKATFFPEQETPFLVQSVLMIGLWVSEKPCTQKLACEIHEKLRVSIHNQRDNWDLSSSHAAPATHWPISTYQGILLNAIFALIKDDTSSSPFSLKRPLPDIEYAFLLALTQSCRSQRMFHYPTMLQHYSDTGSPIYAWTFTEEIKRFGLALYNVSRHCCPLLSHDEPADGPTPQPPLLTLADLQFSMPDSDYLWSAETNAELTRRSKEEGKSGGNEEGSWISSVARFLQPAAVGFDWI
ncbi:C2H2 type zinc finger domain protein [Phyllosticta citribraziliensis]|uniref:C2H2 type zinc finger domain protein n=1 Tax=Phyllosticta citribraziliensis TaxID=989973 RepID=A0ABR1LKQ7_9PEZI